MLGASTIGEVAQKTQLQPCSVQGHAPLRFRCLLLDHDDTTVRGTEELHYPAHVESVQILRPDLEPCTLQEWFERNHDPGISTYLKTLFTTPDLMIQEHHIWERALGQAVPSFYEGMVEVLTEFRARGGLIAVISHSPEDFIWRNYEAHPSVDSIRPDLVLGWNNEPQRRKPSVWPAHEALRRLGVAPQEALVLDDLSPGVKMAKAAGIFVAASGWGHSVPTIQAYMRSECDDYFNTVDEFRAFLLGDSKVAAPKAAL